MNIEIAGLALDIPADALEAMYWHSMAPNSAARIAIMLALDELRGQYKIGMPAQEWGRIIGCRAVQHFERKRSMTLAEGVAKLNDAAAAKNLETARLELQKFERQHR